MLVVLIACQNKKKINVDSDESSVAIHSKKQLQKSYQFTDTLTTISKSKVNNWYGYKNLSSFLKERYTNVSPNTALEFSNELFEVVQKVRDSFQIKELNTESLDARFNVLSSEVLRLKDMDDIPSIKAEEVELQTLKIMEVYSSINAKINAVYAQQSFDEDVNFDESIFEFREPLERRFVKPKIKSKRNARKIPR
ncbi:hypothetical protein [Flavicella sediminum]|uniref:hypothetical protein n=1 Tax=Flavicella sediminum TaxID=2585141 RepID=UPI001124736F|nr:hypothetical protein [Flavicella sediminum]